VERTLKLFLNFFLQEKIQTQETGRTFVPVPFFVFLRGRFCKFFWLNRTSKIGAVEGVRNLHALATIFFTRPGINEITSSVSFLFVLFKMCEE
jgi:hypothetical protein